MTEGERKIFENATLLALKMKEGDHGSKNIGVIWNLEMSRN